MMSTHSRGKVPLTVMLVMFGVLVVGVGLGQRVGPLSPPGWFTGSAHSATERSSQPTWIAIPALDVNAPVFPVGLDRDGSIAAPPMSRAHEAAWYQDGPSPGQFGPAVIVGHVDDQSGPAVFYGLANLAPGSLIEVTVDRNGDGQQLSTFEVVDVRSYNKSYLPPDEVYGDFSHPRLRLITCGGEWVGGDVGYTDNVVVFAELVDYR